MRLSVSHAAVTVLWLVGCAHIPPRPSSGAPNLLRRTGAREYVFTSSQVSPTGVHDTRVIFTLFTLPNGDETATIRTYENADRDEPLARAHLDEACIRELAPPPNAVATFRVTPPPRDLRQLLPTCVPEDLWGAASDILPLLMIQVQPQFRAHELRRVGDRLTFGGYDARWQLPPNVLDARVRADSGVIRLDTLTAEVAVISWDTSPMTVDIVRRLPDGQTALLHGNEWFVATVRIDPRTGELLEGRTHADSLRLRLRLGYPSSVVPDAVAADTAGFMVRIVRQLALRRTPTH